MKKRNGFVSNSSSSSFIVSACDDIEIYADGKASGIKLEDILQMRRMAVNEVDFVNEVFSNYCGYSRGKSFTELVAECKDDCSWFDQAYDMIRNGKVVYKIDVDNGSDMIGMIHLLGRKGILDIVCEEG